MTSRLSRIRIAIVHDSGTSTVKLDEIANKSNATIASGERECKIRSDNDAEAHDARVSVSASGRRRLRERHVHAAEATLAQPGRSVDVDEHEPSDVVRRVGCRQQSLSERQHSPGEGL